MAVEVITWKTADPDTRNRILGRGRILEGTGSSGNLVSDITRLIGDVEQRGDAALVDALRTFDGIEVHSGELAVAEAEIERAEEGLPDPLSVAIDLAIDRSRAFNREIVERATWSATTAGGGTVGEIARPIDSVGLFVPSGKGSFPSVLVQIGTPAVVAGLRAITLVVPPVPGGGGAVDPATLVVARRLGITRILRLNGPSGIGALALGTDSVPRVRKIVGPGSAPVTIAQRLVQSYGCGVVAGLGPTDSLVVADESADPVLLAADVINEAEHGPDSSAVLVATDRGALEDAAREVDRQLQSLPEPRREYARISIEINGGLVLARDLDEALRIANAYAPEHLQLAIADPRAVLARVQYAGTVLLGQWSTFAMSNFVIGTPATLPTTGAATAVSGVTAHTYLNAISTAQIDESEFHSLADAAVSFAEHEGFPAHKASVCVRRHT